MLIGKKMENWKAAGPDGVQGYWIKKLTECHERIAEQLDSLLGDGREIPGWMIYGKTVLCLKDPEKAMRWTTIDLSRVFH